MKPTEISIPTLRRLPLYYQRLLDAVKNGEEFTSSSSLGRAAGATAEQVRKDLSYLAGQGRSRVGYESRKLAEIIADHLGLMNEKEAVLVGAGNLGRALALYPGFARYGLKIIALFDSDPKKVGDQIGNLQVQPATKMGDYIRLNKIRVGILTTPAEAANEVAQILVSSGIKAIWNFTVTRLLVPKEVMVRNVDLSPELAVISYFIKNIDTQSID